MKPSVVGLSLALAAAGGVHGLQRGVVLPRVGVLSTLAADASLYDLRVNGMDAPANVDAMTTFSWKTQGADRMTTKDGGAVLRVIASK